MDSQVARALRIMDRKGMNPVSSWQMFPYNEDASIGIGNTEKRLVRPILNYQGTHVYKINKENWPHTQREHTRDWSSTTVDELLRVGFHDCEFLDCAETHAGSAQEFFIACSLYSHATGSPFPTERDWRAVLLWSNTKR